MAAEREIVVDRSRPAGDAAKAFAGLLGLTLTAELDAGKRLVLRLRGPAEAAGGAL